MLPPLCPIDCKYSDCDYSGDSDLYVGFFPVEKIRLAHERDPYMPKYGFHLGAVCPKCGRHQRWIEQTDDNMLAGKFWLDKQPKML